MEKTELIVCGARGACSKGGKEYEQFGQYTTCFVLRCGNHAVITDCGTGLCAAQEAVRDCERLDVLITHFHYDHIAGLLSCRDICERARFFVPDFAGAKQALLSLSREPYWPVPLGISEKQIFPLSPDADFSTCLGSACAREARHPGGGRIYRVNTPDGGVCFIFDHDHNSEPLELVDFVRGCDTVVYDGMFTQDEYISGRRGHSTALAGAELSAAALVRKLIITHHAPYRDDDALLAMESSSVVLFSGLSFARAGDRFTVGS